MPSLIRLQLVLLAVAAIFVAAPGEASAIRFDFTGIVTEVFEDPDGTIEFPGVAVGDSIEGFFRFASPKDFDFRAEIGTTAHGVSDGHSVADLLVTNTVIDGFAGTDEFLADLNLADPGADFLSDRGTPIDVAGFTITSLRFSEGAFNTVVLGEFLTLALSGYSPAMKFFDPRANKVLNEPRKARTGTPAGQHSSLRASLSAIAPPEA